MPKPRPTHPSMLERLTAPSRLDRTEAAPVDSLMPSADEVMQPAGRRLMQVRRQNISPDPNQPRKTFNEESLAELAESIREHGILQPIEIEEVGIEQFRIVHGERRWRASGLANLDYVPAIIVQHQTNDVRRLARQLVENVQREDLNEVDRAAALESLYKLMQVQADAKPGSQRPTWDDVGKQVGLGRRRMEQLRGLLRLPESLQNEVRQGDVTEKETRVYQGLTNEQAIALHQARRTHSLEEAEVRQIANLLKQGVVQDVRSAVNQIHPLVSAPQTTKLSSAIQNASIPDTLALEDSLNRINRLLRQSIDRYVHLRQQGWQPSPSVEKALAEVNLLLRALDESRRL